jgi:hypothetical protein
MPSKRPPITTRTNIGWAYAYLPGRPADVATKPDVIATVGQLDSRVGAAKQFRGLGRWGVGYTEELYRKLNGKWIRLTNAECEQVCWGCRAP